MSLPLILGLVVIGLIVYVVAVYNELATVKTRIKASIQEIGNQLKRQVELIPNLETSAQAYLKHEKSIIAMLADARKSVNAAVKSGDLDKMSGAQDKVMQLLPKLQVVVESNPELKGAEVITKLMDELRDTSDKVMYSRRTMIDIVADYNVKLVTFPSSIIANMFGFKAEKGLETPDSGAHLSVSDEDTRPVRVKLD